MFSILNRALSQALTGFGNTFYLKKRSRLINALDNRFNIKFMQLKIGLFKTKHSADIYSKSFQPFYYGDTAIIQFKIGLENQNFSFQSVLPLNCMENCRLKKKQLKIEYLLLPW